MSEPFIGEIRMFAGNFAPRGWAYCDGQILAVSQNDSLFSLFGTTYGGDGRSTFGLPDLRGRIPLHQGTGPGLSPRKLGLKAGVETVTLKTTEMASHTHDWNANTLEANQESPRGNVVAQTKNPYVLYRNDNQALGFSAKAVADAGGGQLHTNLMPTLCVHFIVALFGIYPSRS